MNAIGAAYKLPPDKAEVLRRAKRLEWTFIAFLLSIIVVMALVMGSSQTMKAMWIEDTLSLIPSCSFLIGIHFRHKCRTKLSRMGIVVRCWSASWRALLPCLGLDYISSVIR